MSSQHRLQHLGLVDLLHRDLQDVLVDHDEVGRHAGFDGAGLVLLLHQHRPVSGEDLDGDLAVKPLIRVESTESGLPGIPARDHARTNPPHVRMRVFVRIFPYRRPHRRPQ